MSGEEEKAPFPRRQAVTLAFRQLTYTVTAWRRLRRGMRNLGAGNKEVSRIQEAEMKFLRKSIGKTEFDKVLLTTERKEILHGLSGEFRAGEVSVIMGPSGAGKSTLLNILAGFTVRGSGGHVEVNGEERGFGRGLEEFKKLSCYIQQQDVVRPLLRVREAVILAIHLKLGCELDFNQKQAKIHELLKMLGLSKTEETFCKDLSGGQKKRLAIALELVTNPPVIFLDEPTTGLDSATTSSCVDLLSRLAEQGRTIICTLHQPSALLFSRFSQLYCVAKGRSIYQGTPSEMVPFLARFGLNCPPYHNPADFIIEVASGEYPWDLIQLSKEAENIGRKLSTSSTKKLNTSESGLHPYSVQNLKNRAQTSDSDLDTAKSCLPKPASIWFQMFHLYCRNLIVLKRDITMVVSRLVCHLVIGVIFGYLYRDVGNNAETLLANFIFVYGSILFLHYTGQMTVLLSFPLEYEVLTREHFNRWYSLPPYCVSLLLVEVPFQLLCSLVYLFPGYYLTGQPLELDRILMFLTFNLSVCMTAQATGFFSGALMPITVAVFLGPVISVFFSVFGFTSKYTDILEPIRPLYNISYFRSAFQGSFVALYGNNRSDLPCYEFYCHYRSPNKFLQEMEFAWFRPLPELSYIIFIGVITYAATLFIVWYKLTKR